MPEVRFVVAKPRYQVVVPLTGTKVWVPSVNPEPLHHWPVVVSSMASSVELMVAPVPGEAVPVIVPVQSAP